ncbi:MAG TPA: glycosyltransferase family 4 protein [Anaerolineaceae bacterium]|nr:glycosyltransferase family 4 protein [Anaerolineaceae bacterium]
MVERLRIAFITGSLAQGGAEKQLVYMIRALCERGIEVRVHCSTQGEYYQVELEKMGVQLEWSGRWGNPGLRLSSLFGAIKTFRPHIIQSAQFFTNLYAGILGKMLNSVSIGCIRSDIREALRLNGIWGNALLRTPSAIIANSTLAQKKIIEMGFPTNRLFVIPNVIDLAAFDRLQANRSPDLFRRNDHFNVVAIARLTQVKRLERFIQAVALARREEPGIRGVIIGDGPEKQFLMQTAKNEGFTPEDFLFTGARNDIPGLLAMADALALTSDFEGFPNVLLEAMAGSLPVITTPVGEADRIVREGVNGYVIPFEDTAELAARMIRLSRSEDLRRSMGKAGRWLVEQHYSYETLAGQLLRIYREIAARLRNSSLLSMLAYPEAG